MFTSGCLLPSPPRSEVIESRRAHASGQFELITLRPFDLASYRANHRPRPLRRAGRNLLFVAVDETVQVQFAQRLQELYRTNDEVRLEEVSWWRFAPEMRGLYDHVVKIPYDQLNAQSLSEGITLLEEQRTPYDIMLLTHGIPNHITASPGEPFISYKDLEQLPELKSLRMVFMQGCFSETLARDWMLLGAQEVLSYEGWNRNFFFVDFFIKALKKKSSVKEAYDYVIDTIEEKMDRSLLYRKILEEMDLTLEEYFEISPPPIYDSRS